MVEFKEIDCFIPEDVMLFKPVRFEEISMDGVVIGYIAWRTENEPHVEYVTGVSPRAIFETTIEFVKRCSDDVVIKSFKNTKNLFDRVSKKSCLMLCETEKDEFDRGFTFNYRLKR